MDTIEKLTPQEIVTNKKSYSIPIYQRLFEWSTDNVHTLLSDLWHTFFVSKGRDDYYIGMLTSTKENELVDGQQRFVVMMLLGCVLKEYHKAWGNFIADSAVQPRLYFSSRPKDNLYLKARIDDSQDIDKECINVKMKNGIEQISAFLQSMEEGKRKDFAKYIYEHLSFFITELPESYSPTNLNLYFERMNTTGRNLEQHEILKVKLLRHLDDSSIYMQLWNRLADVDTMLITQREKENMDDLCIKVLQKGVRSLIYENVINGMNRNDTNETSLSIEQVPLSNQRPSADRYKIHDSRCPLKFPELLLQTLYLFKGTKEQDVTKDDFFNTSNLLDTFSKYLPYEGGNVKKEDIESFMIELLRCRLILDVCFIRSSENGYFLNMNMPDEDEEESKKRLMMYESMLYVSSSNTTSYKWFGWLMSYVKSLGYIPRADELCEHLKRKDNEEHPLIEGDLSYPNINRYWFWRLDYYLWEDRKSIFRLMEEAKVVADNYVFRRNRSIEHIVPQNPQGNSTLQWNDRNNEYSSEDLTRVENMMELGYQQWDEMWNNFGEGDKDIADKIIRNSLGNLSMISQRLNSSLGNESFEVKQARVKSYCEGSVSGSIESLNLLWVYDKYKNWNQDTFRRNIWEHGYEMIKLLENSFSNKANNNNVNDK